MQADPALRSPALPEEDPAGSGFAAHSVGEGPRAVPDVREFVRRTLFVWGLDEIGHDVCLAVTELTANALRHGCRGALGRAGARPVWVGLLRQGHGVLCVVADPGRGVPRLREPDFTAESGRGLQVVAALSDSWGWTEPDCDGKAVWAVFSGGCAAEEPSAPRLGWPVALLPAC